MPYLTDLADACRRSGLKVVEQPGWRGRGHGQMAGRPKTVACHHTAGPRTGEAPSLGVVQNGRPGLEGPLSHLVLGRSGTVYVVAAGLCYHAGATWNASQANSWAIGIEAEATGVDTWPAAQYDAYVRLVRALCDHYGIPVSAVLGHKEICKPRGRKSDPNFDMAAFRAAVTRTGSGSAAPAASTPPPAKKRFPDMIERQLVTGMNYGRVACPTGPGTSSLVADSWVSVTGDGGGDLTVLFQKNAASDGPPPGAGEPWKGTYRNASRVWKPIPDGTEYLEYWVNVKGKGGSLLIEQKPA